MGFVHSFFHFDGFPDMFLKTPPYIQLNPGGVLAVSTSGIPNKNFQPSSTRWSHRRCLLMRAKPSVKTDMLAKDSAGTDAVDDKGDLFFPSYFLLSSTESKFSLDFSIFLYIFLQEIAIVEESMKSFVFLWSCMQYSTSFVTV